ncbi:MAG TPA: 30S ribosomal protein S18 [Patescibacteria group bacterium]|nr:30S ribosomal protein S18 [Patescibacteria group bacterium]
MPREINSDKKFPRAARRKNCFFDANKIEPIFSETAILKKFLTERGKIVPASKSGICSRHQRALSKSVKQARQLGLLPFTDR